jgi:hypothetical protein
MRYSVLLGIMPQKILPDGGCLVYFSSAPAAAPVGVGDDAYCDFLKSGYKSGYNTQQ